MNHLISAFKSSDIVPFYLGGCSLTVSADGQVMLTPLLEDVMISNPMTNEVIEEIKGDGELITSVQVTPNGLFLSVISQSQQLRIYDVAQQKFVKNFKLSSPVYISCVDSTSSLFAFGGSDGVITVWDIENGYVTHSLKGHGTTISSLKFHGELNSKNWFLVSGDIMGNVKVWDLVKRKNIQSFQEHNTTVRGCSFDNDGEVLITGGRDQVLNIYKKQQTKWKLKNSILTKHQIECCGFLTFDNQDYIYTAGSDNLLKLWDQDSLKLVATTEKLLETTEELMIINVLKFDTNILLVLSDQSLVEVSLSELVSPLPTLKRIAGNHGTIADLKLVGPNFNKLLLATNSPSLRIVDFESRKFEFDLYELHTDLLNGVDSTIDGRWILTCSKDNSALLWFYDEEEDKFELYATFIGHSASVTCVKLPKTPIDKQPNFIVTGSSDLTIKKWSVPKFSQFNHEKIVVKNSVYTRKLHDKDINAIDISPNDEFIATASFDKTGKIWDLDSGEIIGILKGHKRGLWDVRFSSFDKYVVTASGDKLAKMWSLNDFSCVRTFEGHTNSVQQVSFLNKTKQIITTGADGLIKLWDASNGECISTLDNHDNRIWSLYCDEVNRFITGDADGKISNWIDNTDELILEQQELAKLQVENEQSLQNYIFNNDWPNAFLLLLTLNHPMRLYNVIKSCVAQNEDPESVIGSFQLEQCISTLNPDQLLTLLERIKTWNVNNKTFEISQKLIKVILMNYKVEELIKIPRINNILEILALYNERHMSRLSDLVEQSYILDYAIDELNNSIV